MRILSESGFAGLKDEQDLVDAFVRDYWRLTRILSESGLKDGQDCAVFTSFLLRKNLQGMSITPYLF